MTMCFSVAMCTFVCFLVIIVIVMTTLRAAACLFLNKPHRHQLCKDFYYNRLIIKYISMLQTL